MATANFTTAPDNTSDATFRAWITAFFNALATVSTYVPQTGDLDPSTPATPSAANQKRGFRVFRFSDAAQATHPIFIRVDVGSGPSAANRPGIWIQAGNTVDGSGNLGVALGGNLMTSEQVSPDTVGVATTFESHISGDTGRLTISLFTGWASAGGNPWFINVERCPDADGDYEDFAVGVDLISSTKKCYTLTKNGRSLNVLINANSFFPWPHDDSATTAALGLRVGCFPILRISQSRVYNAVTGILIYYTLDYDGIGFETVSVYGSNKTYFMTQRGLALITSGSQAHRVMVRND